MHVQKYIKEFTKLENKEDKIHWLEEKPIILKRVKSVGDVAKRWV